MFVNSPTVPEVLEMTPTLLVQHSDFEWTKAALLAACSHARELNGRIALVKFVPEGGFHPLPGAEARYPLTRREQAEVDALAEIAREYNVPFRSYIMGYRDLEEAIILAADALNAESVLAMRRGREDRILAKRLESHRHFLYTVDQPTFAVGWKPFARFVAVS